MEHIFQIIVILGVIGFIIGIIKSTIKLAVIAILISLAVIGIGKYFGYFGSRNATSSVEIRYII